MSKTKETLAHSKRGKRDNDPISEKTRLLKEHRHHSKKKKKDVSSSSFSSEEVDHNYAIKEVDGENTSGTAKQEILVNLRERGLDEGTRYKTEYSRIRVCAFL